MVNWMGRQVILVSISAALWALTKYFYADVDMWSYVFGGAAAIVFNTIGDELYARNG